MRTGTRDTGTRRERRPSLLSLAEDSYQIGVENSNTIKVAQRLSLFPATNWLFLGL